MTSGTQSLTAEVYEAQADARHLWDIAVDYGRLPPDVPNPEASRPSRSRLKWLSQKYYLPPSYRPRTWGYTILRTTYTDDAAFQTAVDTLTRFMGATADMETRKVVEDYGFLRIWKRQQLEGVELPNSADPRPGEEFYVNRFVNEWALKRWHRDERYFSAATPRLKTAILFDEETVTQLQSMAERDLSGKNELWEAGREFWVKMIEAEPKLREGANMDQGVTDCFRVRLEHLEQYWFDRDRSDPAYMVWEVDQRFPGEWFFTD